MVLQSGVRCKFTLRGIQTSELHWFDVLWSGWMKTLVGYCCHALNLSWTRLSGLLPGVQRYVLFIFCNFFLPANCKSRLIVANLMTLHRWASVCLVKIPISYEKKHNYWYFTGQCFQFKKFSSSLQSNYHLLISIGKFKSS